MPHIHTLDSHVADLIAAGEVVERPASVVKELMENAIDAGANSLTVEIEHGGMTLIRVTDDGCGIHPEELPTAFLRHATSKIRSEEDLERIGTLGFRGEALAAIASVARVEVFSRTPEHPLGAALTLVGGVAGAVEEAGCPQGTTMVVRNLFYNTPARLKFVKKDAAEGAAVFAVVQREALAHPEVSVKFLRDGKQELLTPGDGQLRSAVYAVLGRDLALGLLPLSGSGEQVSVEGFASLPACCRGTRGSQHFFVNGRYVKSRLMTAALEEAYQNQKMVGKFPACVLHVTTRPGAVDVNVHPTKTEVKFVNEKQVFDAVHYAVLSRLNADHGHPVVTLPSQPPAPQSAPAVPVTAPLPVRPSPVETAIPQTDSLLRSEPVWSRRPPVGSVFPSRPAPGKAPVSTGHPAVSTQNLPLSTKDDSLSTEPLDLSTEPVYPPASLPEVSTARVEVSTEEPFVSTAGEQLSMTEPPPSPAAEVSAGEEPWRVAGEVLRTYIIVEQGDKILFIDKHAAHERMNFDRLKAETYDPMSQQLLTPVVVNLPAEESAALLEHLPLLEEYGFEVEEFGPGVLTVRRAPFDLAVEQVEETLAQLANRLLTTGSADPASARDELLHTMACKAAIKGGWKSAEEELQAVAAAVVRGEVKYCPHGRPVAIELTRKQLEKQFKRV